MKMMEAYAALKIVKLSSRIWDLVNLLARAVMTADENSTTMISDTPRSIVRKRPSESRQVLPDLI